MKDYDNFFLPVDNLEKAKDYYLKLGFSIKFCRKPRSLTHH